MAGKALDSAYLRDYRRHMALHIFMTIHLQWYFRIVFLINDSFPLTLTTRLLADPKDGDNLVLRAQQL